MTWSHRRMWSKLFGRVFPSKAVDSPSAKEEIPVQNNDSINESNTIDYWPTKAKEKRTKVAVSAPMTVEERMGILSLKKLDSVMGYKELLVRSLESLDSKSFKLPAHHKKIKTLPGNDYLQTKDERNALKEYRIKNVPPPNYITENVFREANCSMEKAPPTLLEPIKPNFFDIEYPSKIYFPGRYHDYNGAHKVFPLKTIPGTVSAFFPRDSGHDPVFVEDELIPDMLQQRITAIKKAHEKTKYSVALPVRRFKKHALDLSRKNVSNKFCNPNDPNADDTTVKKRYLEYAHAWSPDPKLFNNIKKKILDNPDDSLSVTQGTSTSDRHNKSLLSSTSEFRRKEKGVDDNSQVNLDQVDDLIDNNDIESSLHSSSLGAKRSSHLDEMSLLPSTLIKVRMQRNKFGKGLKRYHIKMPINMESKSTSDQRLRRIHVEKEHLKEIKLQTTLARRKAYGLE